MNIEEIKKELAATSHADNRAVRLLMDLVLDAGGSIGMSDEQLADLESAVRSTVEQFGILSDEVHSKLAQLVATDEKVQQYHTSVLEQISALSAEKDKALAAQKKLIEALEKRVAALEAKA